MPRPPQAARHRIGESRDRREKEREKEKVKAKAKVKGCRRCLQIGPQRLCLVPLASDMMFY